MNETVISVENLSKRYFLSHLNGAGEGLRHRVERLARAPFRWLNSSLQAQRNGHVAPPAARGGKEEFWALKDVSFEIKRGEVVGIIGRNGAGKSTLLKILSRIIEPTLGRIVIEGRVASLLEVGTGFHPELTGRENIFLNGAILGMSRVEIKSKFDEIVSFAEIEKFLDTPVKHYSSGMYVRLAFAVAAHLEPEILIVDEVLAVGDAQFQKKCMGKMESVAQSKGRTILFVSHDMQAMQRLTRNAVVLDQGRCAFIGPTEDALVRYSGQFRTAQTMYEIAGGKRQVSGTGHVVLDAVWFTGRKAIFDFGATVSFRARVRAQADVVDVALSLTFVDGNRTALGSGFSSSLFSMSGGQVLEFEVVVRDNTLAPGHYNCVVGLCRDGWLGDMVLHDVVFDVLYFEIEPPENSHGLPGHWHSSWGNSVLPVELFQEFGTGDSPSNDGRGAPLPGHQSQLVP